MTPVEKAYEKLGDKESPPNSNRTLYGKWMSMDGQPWCMSFVQWCFAMSGYHLPYKTASCSMLLNWYKQNHPDAVRSFAEATLPNDIIIFNFGHTGIVTKPSATGKPVYTIEGNTSPDDKGSQSDGGMVCEKVRNRSLVQAVIRPFKFEKEVESMTIDEFINKLTPEQAYKIVTTAAKHSDKLKEPDWSKKEAHWARAEKAGIVKDGRPESYLKRDEVISILGRAKLL